MEEEGLTFSGRVHSEAFQRLLGKKSPNSFFDYLSYRLFCCRFCGYNLKGNLVDRMNHMAKCPDWLRVPGARNLNKLWHDCQQLAQAEVDNYQPFVVGETCQYCTSDDLSQTGKSNHLLTCVKFRTAAQTDASAQALWENIRDVFLPAIPLARAPHEGSGIALAKGIEAADRPPNPPDFLRPLVLYTPSAADIRANPRPSNLDVFSRPKVQVLNDDLSSLSWPTVRPPVAQQTILLLFNMTRDACASDGGFAQIGFKNQWVRDEVLPGCQKILAACRAANIAVMHLKRTSQTATFAHSSHEKPDPQRPKPHFYLQEEYRDQRETYCAPLPLFPQDTYRLGAFFCACCPGSAFMQGLEPERGEEVVEYQTDEPFDAPRRADEITVKLKSRGIQNVIFAGLNIEQSVHNSVQWAVKDGLEVCVALDQTGPFVWPEWVNSVPPRLRLVAQRSALSLSQRETAFTTREAAVLGLEDIMFRKRAKLAVIAKLNQLLACLDELSDAANTREKNVLTIRERK